MRAGDEKDESKVGKKIRKRRKKEERSRMENLSHKRFQERIMSEE